MRIALMERYAPRYDARALTCIQMAVSCVGFTAVALSLGQLRLPHGGTVWSRSELRGGSSSGAGDPTDCDFAWIQAFLTTTASALLSKNAPLRLGAECAALFLKLLIGERLGWTGWTGCAVILAGIALA